MTSDWILEVLADLKNYAKSNDLPMLAQYLDETSIIALTEIAAAHGKTDRVKRRR